MWCLQDPQTSWNLLKPALSVSNPTVHYVYIYMYVHTHYDPFPTCRTVDPCSVLTQTQWCFDALLHRHLQLRVSSCGPLAPADLTAFRREWQMRRCSAHIIYIYLIIYIYTYNIAYAYIYTHMYCNCMYMWNYKYIYNIKQQNTLYINMQKPGLDREWILVSWWSINATLGSSKQHISCKWLLVQWVGK